MTWTYSSRVDRDRQSYLLTAPEFPCIAANIVEQARVVRFQMVTGNRPEVKGCKRAEFKLQVARQTFDLFFNSPTGYRAQYHKSVLAGERANAELVSMIFPKLIEHVKGHDRISAIACSLQANSAKVWIDEAGKRNANEIELIEELLVESWLGTARCYKENPSKYFEAVKAIDGIRAPLGTILEVKGAFIAEDNRERIPNDKRDRSLHIHLYGFA